MLLLLHDFFDDLMLASQSVICWLLLLALYHLEGDLLGAILDALSLWLGLSVLDLLYFTLEFRDILLQRYNVLCLNLNDLI